MAPHERGDDDEMDLINAEFESMVSGLNLDQSSPRTYLDDLDAIEREEVEELHRQNRVGSDNSSLGVMETIRRWWNRKSNDEGDGAAL